MPNALELYGESGEPELTKGQLILGVGRSGCGKSAAMASFLEMGPLYIFDADHRIRGVLGAAEWLGKEKLKLIDYDQYKATDGFSAIDSKLSVFKIEAIKKQLKPKSLIFDSFTSITNLLTLDSLNLRGLDKGEKEIKGKVRGNIRFLHPDDYNYCSLAWRMIMYNGLFPLIEAGINVFVNGWIVDKYGRPGGEYSTPEVIGEKLLLPDKLSEELPGYFDEVYYFRRQKAPPVPGKPPVKFTVEFKGEFARTSLPLPSGEVDITNKSFYSVWKELIKKHGSK